MAEDQGESGMSNHIALEQLRSRQPTGTNLLKLLQIKRPHNQSSLFRTQLFLTFIYASTYLFGLVLNFCSMEFFGYIAILTQIAFMLFSWNKIQPGFLNLYSLFILVVLVTHGSIPILELLSIRSGGELNNALARNLDSADLWSASFVIAIFLSAFNLGGLTFKWRSVENSVITRWSKNVTNSSMWATGVFLIIIGAICFSIYVHAVGLVASVSYYNAYFYGASSAGTFAYNLMYFVVSGAFILLVFGKRKSPIVLLAYAALAAWIVFFAILGSSNRALSVAIATLLAARYRGLFIPKSFIFGFMAFGVAIAFEYSQYRLTGTLNFSFSSKAILSFIPLSLEQLGVYYYIVAATVKQYTETWFPNFGVSYINTIFFTVPFGQRIYYNSDVVSWLAKMYYSQTLAVNSRFGTGFSFIAEAFESFSWLGCILIFYVGRFYAKLSLAAEQSKLGLFIVLATLPFTLFYARDVSAGLVRGLVWYALLPILIARLIKRIS